MRILIPGELVGIDGAIWVALLLDLAIKGGLLLATATILHKCLGRVAPAIRSQFWSGVFVALLMIPALSSGWIRFDNTPALTFATPLLTVAQDDSGLIARLDLQPDQQVSSGDASGRLETPVPPSSSSFDSWVWVSAVIVWLSGLVIGLGRVIFSLGAGLRIGRRNARVVCSEVEDVARSAARELGVTRRFRIVMTEDLEVPVLAGFVTPRLVIPVAMTEWPRAQLRAVFLHELAHLRRGDTLRMLLYSVVSALYWFNPLVWWMSARARLDQELACDELVCRQGVAGAEYARLLLSFAAGDPAIARSVQAPGFVRARDLERRIQHVLQGGRWRPDRNSRHWWYAPLTIVLTGCAVLFISATVSLDRPGVLAIAIASLDQPAAPDGNASAETMSIHDLAAAGGVVEMAARLDARPELLDSVNRNGMTLVAVAAWYDHIDIVEELSRRGANPDIKNHNGLTPLFSAVDRGRKPMARLLVQAGADVATTGYRGRTLVHMAARSGDDWILARAVATGADVNAADIDGVRPLDFARWGDHRASIEYLEGVGAKGTGKSRPQWKNRPGMKVS